MSISHDISAEIAFPLPKNFSLGSLPMFRFMAQNQAPNQLPKDLVMYGHRGPAGWATWWLRPSEIADI